MLMKLDFFDRFSKNPQMSECMKTHTVGFKLFQGGRWIDVATLKITLQFLQRHLKTGNILITNG